MRRCLASIALTTAALLVGGSAFAPAAEPITPSAKQARDKFAKLLLSAGPAQTTTIKGTAKKTRKVAVNAFAGLPGGPPATTVNPGRPGFRP